MRTNRAALLNIAFALTCAAQSYTPIPADPHELVTGSGSAVAQAMDRGQALALLNRAKLPMRLLAPNTPPYLLTVTFTMTGDAANSGSDEFKQLWLGAKNWRWTAKLGDFTINRIGTQEGSFDEKPVRVIPMRLHMLRNSVFWAAQGLTATSEFRSAPAQWKGKPVTCLLISDRPEAVETPGRRWEEAEYCIDDQTGLLQILSVAPGNYAVYSYGAGQIFHGRPIPDRIETYIAGAVASDAKVKIADPDGEIGPMVATPEMKAGPKIVFLEEPLRQRMLVPAGSGTTGSVMINAQEGPDGKVVVAELCTATDPSLVKAALDRTGKMDFGANNLQRQVYVEVRFVAGSAMPSRVNASPAAQVATVRVEPYYIEQTISFPGSKRDSREAHARRSDGATFGSVEMRGSDQTKRDLRLPDGAYISLFDGIKGKVTWPAMRDRERNSLAARAQSVPGDCGASAGMGKILRHEQMQGQDVVVIQRADGSYRTTFYAAPRLACQYLYVLSETVAFDGGFRTSAETKTVRVVVGEPDPKLFEIPGNFQEMKPSEAVRRSFEAADLGMTAEQKTQILRELEREGAELDRQYQVKHP